jgi:hypothetical protein
MPREPGSNFHDSTLDRIDDRDGEIALMLSAYVHRWEGAAGARTGTGWKFPARIVVHRAAVAEQARAGREWISDGSLETKAAMYSHMVPVPLRATDRVRLRLEWAGGMSLDVSGDGIEIDLMGEGVFVEALPMDFDPNQAEGS